jgi:hypothetical protein
VQNVSFGGSTGAYARFILVIFKKRKPANPFFPIPPFSPKAKTVSSSVVVVVGCRHRHTSFSAIDRFFFLLVLPLPPSPMI